MAEEKQLNTILSDVADKVGVRDSEGDFDNDLLGYINAAIATLFQNGVGSLIVADKDTTWGEFQNPDQNNDYFALARNYVYLSTKILFDPPPPSNVQYVKGALDEALWRAREGYKEDRDET